MDHRYIMRVLWLNGVSCPFDLFDIRLYRFLRNVGKVGEHKGGGAPWKLGIGPSARNSRKTRFVAQRLAIASFRGTIGIPGPHEVSSSYGETDGTPAKTWLKTLPGEAPEEEKRRLFFENASPRKDRHVIKNGSVFCQGIPMRYASIDLFNGGVRRDFLKPAYFETLDEARRAERVCGSSIMSSDRTPWR